MQEFFCFFYENHLMLTRFLHNLWEIPAF